LRALGGIRYLDDSRVENTGAGAAAAVERPRLQDPRATPLAAVLGIRHGFQQVSIGNNEADSLSGEQTLATLDDRVEHRPCVGDRTADNAQDLCSRGLAIERLLRLLEQPCVLDRDHCLVAERGEQRKLLVRERPHWLVL